MVPTPASVYSRKKNKFTHYVMRDSLQREVYLEVSALGTEPFLDEVLGLSAKAEHEIPLGLELVDGLNGLMDLERGACVKCAPALGSGVLSGSRAKVTDQLTLTLAGPRKLTLTSREAISCWLVVEARKLLIWAFSGSSTSTSMS